MEYYKNKIFHLFIYPFIIRCPAELVFNNNSMYFVFTYSSTHNCKIIFSLLMNTFNINIFFLLLQLENCRTFI